MNTIKLAVFDVDGTLVSAGSRILLESTVRAIQMLQENGVKVAIASGRPKYALEKSVVDRISFDYYICSNGSYIYDNKQKVVLYQQTLSNHDVMRYAILCETTNSAAMFQFENAGYIYAGYHQLSTMLLASLGRLDFIVDHCNEKKQHLVESTYMIVSYISDEHLDIFCKQFPQLQFIPFQPNFYDVNYYLDTKATGIQHICETMGFSLENVIAFGDALNDKEMLETVGCGVAMGNGLAEIKEIADYITTNTEQDGIFNALTHLGLI